jgi:hypothetical protein
MGCERDSLTLFPCYFRTIKVDFVSGIRIFPEVGGDLPSSSEPGPLFLLD